jgi:hypothetical protein
MFGTIQFCQLFHTKLGVAHEKKNLDCDWKQDTGILW